MRARTVFYLIPMLGLFSLISYWSTLAATRRTHELQYQQSPGFNRFFVDLKLPKAFGRDGRGRQSPYPQRIVMPGDAGIELPPPPPPPLNNADEAAADESVDTDVQLLNILPNSGSSFSKSRRDASTRGQNRQQLPREVYPHPRQHRDPEIIIASNKPSRNDIESEPVNVDPRQSGSATDNDDEEDNDGAGKDIFINQSSIAEQGDVNDMVAVASMAFNQTAAESATMTAQLYFEIAAQLQNAEWIRPIPVPNPTDLRWTNTTVHTPQCSEPSATPQRMYTFNHPIRCLSHFRAQSGFLLFVQGHPIPNSINPIPVIYTKNWRLSRAFGRWSAKWIKTPAPYPPTRSQVTMAEAELYVMVFQNSWVYRGSVVQCNRYFAPGACSGLQEPIQSFVRLPPKTGEAIGDSVFVLCDRHCKGYYHWTHEQLPRLGIMYDRLIANPNIIITVPINGMIMQYMQLLGFNKTQVRDIYKKVTKDRYPTVFYRTVYYPQPMRCGSVLAPQLYLIRKILLGRMGLPHTRQGPVDPNSMAVVLADRTDKRQPRNHRNISRILREKFPTVSFKSHLGRSVRDQILLFNQADLIIGPHGANLGNIMWCRQGTTVLEYVPAKTGNLCYYQTASKLDLQYRMLMLDMMIDTPHVVPVEEVVRHVEDVYQGLTSCRNGSRWIACPSLYSTVSY